jgi:hypothetical protein
MYASLGHVVYTAPMLRLRHFYGENHLHYLSSNIYRRARICDFDRFKLTGTAFQPAKSGYISGATFTLVRRTER